MRISVEQSGSYVPLDETFNKHIIFHTGGVTGNISYTGVARWTVGGRTTNLYDVISEAVAAAATKDLTFAPFTLALIDRIQIALSVPTLRTVRSRLHFELHVIGYHRLIPIPFIAVISTYRRAPPWQVEAEFQREYQFGEISLYLKAADLRPPNWIVFG
jgi:hypothetical protein